MTGERVRCPTCLEQGDTSTVRIDCIIKTAMESSFFYDEDGRLHQHDPNKINATYTCSHDHTWNDTRSIPCWCGWPPPRKEDSAP